MWKQDTSGGVESHKDIRWEIFEWTPGNLTEYKAGKIRGIEIGGSPQPTYPHFYVVDDGSEYNFWKDRGYKVYKDLAVPDYEEVSKHCELRDLEYVFSSFVLQRVDDYKKALKDWWSMLKVGGYLIVYLPHAGKYPTDSNINPRVSTYKHHFIPEDITDAMKEFASFDLIENEVRDFDEEFAFLQVYKKTTDSHTESWRDVFTGKDCWMFREGGYGDLVWAASAVKGLHDQGKRVSVIARYPQASVLEGNPYIHRIIPKMHDQVPNANLSDFFAALKKKMKRRGGQFINLSETAEVKLLVVRGHPKNEKYQMPLDESGTMVEFNQAIFNKRQQDLNKNYLEVVHKHCGVPHVNGWKFYPTEEEKAWAWEQRKDLKKIVIMYSIVGSSVNKIWPWMDGVVERVITDFANTSVVLVGGPEAEMLEGAWKDANPTRVKCIAGQWSMRQTLAFLELCDVVIGPETGVLNAAAPMLLKKIVLMSHSSVKNLTRDWINTTSMTPTGVEFDGHKLTKPECFPCHEVHYNWSTCKRCPITGAGAACQVAIDPNQLVEVLSDEVDRLGGMLHEIITEV